MKHEITDAKINKLLAEKNEYSTDNSNIIMEIEKLEKKYNGNISKMARIDEKVRPMILKIVSTIKLGEYQELSKVFKDGNKWFMEFADRMEEFKNLWKKK